jgi:arsenate reductase
MNTAGGANRKTQGNKLAERQEITIYHNPRCGKRRSALAILNGRGIEPEIVEYLENPPTREELRAILKKLCMKPEQLVRKGEDLYKEKCAGKTLSDEQWLDALRDNPILIERPIIVKGSRAVVGRPPEKVEELL